MGEGTRSFSTVVRQFTAVLILLPTLFNVVGADEQKAENPFVGAAGYVNPDYVENVRASQALVDPEIRDDMAVVSQQPTAVWLDSIAAISGYDGKRLSLTEHLVRAAQYQQARAEPVTFLVVIYSLPDRDCAALASNGLLQGETGLSRYREQYIDPIANTFDDERFAQLRIVALIEPDSLPNLVTNRATPACQRAYEQGTYADGISYALSRFSGIDNVYSYLDIGHSGWLGWDNNRARAVELYSQVVLASGSLYNIHGVVTNVSSYVPTEESLLPDPDYVIEGRGVKAADFYEYNSKFDERDYAIALHEDFLAAGFPEHFGVLIDTSRNGWGGDMRPSDAVWRSSVNDYVNAARLDRRFARGNWCNQSGAGVGELPRADPYQDQVVHAFVWVKPPGESDGTSDKEQTTPDDEGKSFDPNCDPDGSNELGLPTGALPASPVAGAWFHEQFEMLVRNASPRLR